MDEEDEAGRADTQPGPGEPPAGEDRASSPPEEAPMRQAVFMGIVVELPSTHPTVVLQEIDEPRRELSITIGQTEGVSIAYAWRGVPAPRPLTHDLLTTILDQFGLQIDAVRIVGAEGAVFFAELALSGPTGTSTVPCRPSDALAVALRQRLPVPIMVAEDILGTAGRIPGP